MKKIKEPSLEARWYNAYEAYKAAKNIRFKELWSNVMFKLGTDK